MQPFAEKFYKGRQWRKTREDYAHYAGGLCEVCWSKGLVTPGEIVHHKIPITPENINDPEITLSWSNLQLVCRDCHGKIHDGKVIRYKLDNLGRVVFQ